MSHLSTTEVGGLYPRAHRAAVAMIAATMVSLGWAADANADHGLPLGANYGVTDAHAPGVDAPAFPGPKAFWFGTCDLQDPSTSENGVGIAPAVARTCIDIGESYAPANAFDPDPPRETTWGPGGEPSWRLDNVSQAGSHPDISVSFWMQRSPHSPLNSGSNHTIGSDGDTKNAIVRLPAGFLGNPNAVPPCPAELLRGSPPLCGPESQIGIATVTLGGGGVTSGGATEPGLVERMPIWSVEPRDGKLAEFMMVVNYSGEGRVNIPVVARARTEGDYGVDTLALKLQALMKILK